MFLKVNAYNKKKYKQLKKKGKTAEEAYSIAKAEGLNPLECMNMLCKVYHIPFTETKDFMIKIDYSCASLDEYQEKHILPVLKEIFEAKDQSIDS